MALFNKALALFSISTLLLSTFALDETPSPSPAPVPLSYISSTPTSSPSPSPAESTELLPHDEKARMARYVKVTMQATTQKLDEVQVEFKKRLDDPETSSTAKECFQQCTEVYDSAKEDIVNSLMDIESGDLYKANFDITSISTNVDTCEECFEEMIGEEPELKKFDDWVRGVTDDCLEALNTIAS